MTGYAFEEMRQSAMEIAHRMEENGGTLYLVGGCVRDWKLGMKPSDYDFLVTGLTQETFRELFPTAPFVGHEIEGFPVFLLDINGSSCEVAFARKEKKVGVGYKGFETYTDPLITVEEDLLRRDLTINAMAVNVRTGALHDPYSGEKDLKRGIVRHVSEAFREDPLRVLRAARFAARFNFSIDQETVKLMHGLREELATMKPERLCLETKKALEGERPSKYFQTLADIGMLDIHYKELDDLIGVAQPVVYHPEGDAFTHTMLALDAMAKRSDNVLYRFAILTHDLGKGLFPSMWIEDPIKYPFGTHRGHEELGVPLVEALANRLKVPTNWRKAAMFAAEYHGEIHLLGIKSKTKSIRKMIRMITKASRNPLGISGLSLIATADVNGKGLGTVEHPYTAFLEHVAKEVLEVKADTSFPVEEIAEEKELRQVQVYRRIKQEMLRGDEIDVDQ